LPDAPDSQRDWYLWAGVLALLTMVCFWPAISGSFLWDDDHYITHNTALNDLSGLRHIWFKPIQTVQYYPLTYTSFWIEHHFWGNSPLGYHVVSLLMHALSAIILWRLLRRLSLPGAWVAAAIWAIHPLQAESVCWISERKNVLSGLLALASFLFYLEYAGLRDPDSSHPLWKLSNRWQLYAISLVLFTAAMFSKTVVCCVPVALLLVLWWQRRLDREKGLGLIPMFIIGIALSAITGYCETNPNGYVRATGPEWNFTPVTRVLLAAHAVWFYLAKIFLPIHLSFNYPRIVPDPTRILPCCYLAAAFMVVAYLFVARERLGRGPLVAALCYLAALFPSMGFVNAYPFRFSFVWDHFQYLAGIPIMVAVIAGIAPFFSRRLRAAATAGRGLAIPVGLTACLLLVTAVDARDRANVFVDDGQLWSNTLANNPGSWFAASNLARLRLTGAGNSITEAARLSQPGGDQESSQASAQEAVDQLDDAQRLLNDVIANPQTPDDVREQAFTELAAVQITRRRLPGADVMALMTQAEGNLQHAVDREKTLAEADRNPLPYYNMGLVKTNEAQFLEQELHSGATTEPAIPPTTRPATAAEQRILDIYALAQENFLLALEAARTNLYAINNWGQARQLFELSARQRGNIDWHLAVLAHERGDRAKSAAYTSEALADYQGAYYMNPDDIETNYQIALCLEYFGHYDEAQWHLRRIVIKLNPFYAPAYNEIGLLLLLDNPHPSMDDLQTAIQCFKDALNLDKNLTDARSNLKRATALLATARPVTRPSTAPAARP
jgi:tetratricopeptide (TPR) repeat protein